MNLLKLKQIVDLSFNTTHEPESVSVVITTCGESVGAREFSDVSFVGLGFDYEHGQLRIEPNDKLYKENKTSKDAQQILLIEYLYDKRKSQSYHCPICKAKVPSDSKYCSYCGKSLLPPNGVTQTFDCRTNNFKV